MRLGRGAARFFVAAGAEGPRVGVGGGEKNEAGGAWGCPAWCSCCRVSSPSLYLGRGAGLGGPAEGSSFAGRFRRLQPHAVDFLGETGRTGSIGIGTLTVIYFAPGRRGSLIWSGATVSPKKQLSKHTADRRRTTIACRSTDRFFCQGASHPAMQKVGGSRVSVACAHGTRRVRRRPRNGKELTARADVPNPR